MQRLLILAVLLSVAGCQPSAPPKPIVLRGKVVAVVRSTTDNSAIGVQTDKDTAVVVLVVGRDNPLNKKTKLVLRTAHSVQDLLGKQVKVIGWHYKGGIIATFISEERP